MSGLHIILFRTDLRVHDHAALRSACVAAARDGGKVLALYVFSRSDLNVNAVQPTRSDFLIDAVRELQAALTQRDIELHIRSGDRLEVLSDLHRLHGLSTLHVHDGLDLEAETRALTNWSLRAGVALRIYAQYGPNWQDQADISWRDAWETFMLQPRHEAPDTAMSAQLGVGQWPSSSSKSTSTDRQTGGRKEAIKLLRAYLSEMPARHASNSAAFKSGADLYQELRPFLDLGAVSVREVWQAAMSARQQYEKANFELRVASIDSLLKLLPSQFLKQNRVQDVRRPIAPAKPGQQLSLHLRETP